MEALEGLPSVSVGATYGGEAYGGAAYGGAANGEVPQAIWQVASFLDDLRDPLVVIDDFGRMCFVNRAFERFIGHTRASLLGLDISAVIEMQFVDLTVDLAADMTGGVASFSIGSFPATAAPPHPAKALFRRAGSLGLAEVPVRWGDIAPLSPVVAGVRYVLVVEPRPLVEAVLSRLDELRTLHHELGELLHENADADGSVHRASTDHLARPTSGSAAVRAELSKREQEILRLVADGKRVGTIANLLYLSENTVRNHLKRMYRKLDVSSLGELREHVVVSSLRTL